MKNLNKYIVMTLVFVSLILNSCEDAPPVDYQKQVYVETFLRVDDPIKNVLIFYTQPINTPYDREKALISDASVKIATDKDTFNLVFDNINKSGYYLPDTQIKIQPETKYYLIVTTKNGEVIKGKTTTPKRISWITPPRSKIFYPQDTLKLPANDSLRLEWTPTKDTAFYFVKVRNLDTLNYGKYLPNPTDERNRRCYNMFVNNETFDKVIYRNQSYWALIANTKTPTVWLAFRWFGKHEVSAVSPDFNMLNWYINLFFAQDSATQPLLNSVEGGIGVFGSYSSVDSEVFLYKNQP